MVILPFAPALAKRINAKIQTSGDCWMWTGWIGPDGYGKLWVKSRGSMYGAHRVIYELLQGPVAKGFELDHLCPNRACVNPDHLEVVTHAENIRRARARKLACPRGHQYSGPVGPCRTCHRDRVREAMRRWRARHAEA